MQHEDSAAAADPDAALMCEVARGSEAALRMLIQRWQKPLINFFARSVADHATAEDLAQQTFIKLYRAAGRYQPSARFSTYLFHIARRVLISEYRRASTRPFDATDPAEIRAQTGGRNEQHRRELEDAFAEALGRLPENQRSAILLLKQQGLAYGEIAEALDASVSAVKTWIFRARQTLREDLKAFR